MHKKRRKVYRNLINPLLSCNEGEEWELLQAHQELLDSDFIEVMKQVAEELEKKGDGEGAAFLGYLADELVSISVDREIIEKLFDFLLKVLQATEESKGNAEKVYPLLEANIDKLDARLAELLQVWATTTLAEVKPEVAEEIAAVIVLFSNLIQQFPLGDKASNMEIAITGYEIALAVFTHEAFPYEWAMTKNNLASAYSDRIRGERAENLEQAIALYQETLKVITFEAFPYEWAGTQHNLASAYSNRIRGERAENLEQAIALYQEALKVRTFEAFPYEWAGTQHNLALAYSNRIRGERAENLEQAIAFFQEALKVYTIDAFPQKNAETLSNLGRVSQEAKQFELAYITFESAITTVESLREEIVSGEESKRSIYCVIDD